MPSSLRRIWITSALLVAYEGKKTYHQDIRAAQGLQKKAFAWHPDTHQGYSSSLDVQEARTYLYRTILRHLIE